tara:strand:+ start:2926 stop:3294 length:369 start_codon:yes stop_codon:yes gene_type:complete
MPVQVGDLVGFYRRKSPGMGIVLDKIDDILDHAGVDESIAFQIAENAQGRTYWEKKSAIEELCDGQKVHSTSLRLFFQYNDRWCSKPKKSFVRIKWFKQPRAYEGRIAENEGWYPADWVRSK